MARVTLILPEHLYTLDTTDDVVEDLASRRAMRLIGLRDARAVGAELASFLCLELASLVNDYASESYWPRDDLCSRDDFCLNEAPLYQQWFLRSELARNPKDIRIVWGQSPRGGNQADCGIFAPQHQDIRPLSKSGSLMDCWYEVVAIRTPTWTEFWLQEGLHSGAQIILLSLFGAALVRHPDVILPIVIPVQPPTGGDVQKNWMDTLMYDSNYFQRLASALKARLYGNFCPAWWIPHYSPVGGSREAFDQSGQFAYLHASNIQRPHPPGLVEELPTLARKCFLMGQLLEVYLEHRNCTLAEWIASEPYFVAQRARFLREQNIVTVAWAPMGV